MKISRKWLRRITPILVLVIAVLIASYFLATKPQITLSPPEEKEWLVDTKLVIIGDQDSPISAYGEILSERDADMRALVSGEVIEVSPAFKDGGLVRSGEMLVRIDPFVFKSAVSESEAVLVASQARLSEYKAQYRAEEIAIVEGQAQLNLALRELDRRKQLFAKDVVSEKHVDDAELLVSERNRQVSLSLESMQALSARIEGQVAEITRARVLLSRAQNDLEKTVLRAPFEGYLTDTEATIGKRLSVNDRVAGLLDSNSLEVGFHLSDAEYGRILDSDDDTALEGRLAEVIWRVGGRVFKFPAVIERISGKVEAQTGGLRVYAAVDTSREDIQIRPGTFVEVVVSGPVYGKSAKLPESVLYNDKTVYVVKNNRLTKRQVTLLTRFDRMVIVRGQLQDGEYVVTSRFSEIGPELKVRIK